MIIVKGKLRMGCQIQKHRLLWCMETSDNPNTDTALQSLLGRCMGYPSSSGAHTQVKVWISTKLFDIDNPEDEVRRYIDLFDDLESGNELRSMPQRGMNVTQQDKPPQDENGIRLYHTVPELHKIPLDEWEENNLEDLKGLVRDHVITSSTSNDTEYRNKILGKLEIEFSYIGEKKWHSNKGKGIRTHEEDCPGHIKHLQECVENEKVDKDMRFVKKDKIKIWAKNLGIKGRKLIWDDEKTFLDCYVQYFSYRKHPSDNDSLPNVDTTNQEVFGGLDEAEDQEDPQQEGTLSNGIQKRIISPETSKSVELMMNCIEECVIDSLKSTSRATQLAKNITSDNTSKGFKGICVNKEVNDSLQPGGIIYNYIQNKFGRKLELTKSRGRIPTKQFEKLGLVARYAKFSW